MTTDGNAIYKDVENIDDLITSLQVVAAKLFKWFSDYEMKGNTDKCHLLQSKDESSEIHKGDSIIEISTRKKLLGIKIDLKLPFDDHIQDLFSKTNRKLRALARATPYVNLQKRKVLDFIIESSTREKLLGIKIDSKFCFDDHIQDLFNKPKT